MFSNYLKIALRHLSRNKIYVLINTLGMGIAMACCMTSYLLIAYNIEFDQYFKKESIHGIVKVIHHYTTSDGHEKRELTSPIGLAPRAAQEIAGIAAYTRFCNEGGILSFGENAFQENLRFADASFFQLFDMKLAKGSVKSFNNLQSIILSGPMAIKYFGGEDPIGKIITVELNGKRYQATVGGVLEKIPLNVSFHIDALLRIETYLNANEIDPDRWDSNWSATALFKLSDHKQRSSISRQMDKYVRLNNGNEKKESRSVSFELVPFLQPVINGEVEQSDLRLPIPTIALFIFGTLGLIILLIACFNLTNTTMALAGKRQKEIGVRKVIGSGRIQIAYQFLIEMIITISLAIGAGVLMAQLIVPQFALMWRLQFGLNDLSGINFVVALVLLLFIASLLAGIYPALANSKLSPIILLKGNKGVHGTNPMTRSLLVIQFSLSVIVLLAGIVFTQNASYQKTLDMGYDKENLLTVSVQGEQEFNQFKNTLESNAKIELIAGAENHIGPYARQYRTVRIDTASFKTGVYNIGVNYFETIGLDFIKGRDFMEGSQTDNETAIVVDENFVLNHHLTNPIDVRIFFEEKPYRIIGIVKSHLSGLKQHDGSEHVYRLSQPAQYSTMVIRATSDDLLSVRSEVEKEWKKLFSGKPFQSVLQEEIVFEEANGYNTNLKQIFFFLTVLGCLLSISGIYAMTSLNVQRRTKEIGVRKVLGGSVAAIIQLLNKDFAIILALAALIGGTSGYFLTSALLANLYAQHMIIGWGTVILSGLIIFVIGILTTSATIFKAATANPTHTLRSE